MGLPSEYVYNYAFSSQSPHRGLGCSPQGATYYLYTLGEKRSIRNESASWISQECEAGGAMARWLENTDPITPHSKPAINRSRMLAQDWPNPDPGAGKPSGSQGFYRKNARSNDIHLSKEGFGLLIKHLSIDSYYPYAYLTRGYWISTLESKYDHKLSDTVMRAIFQSPRYSSLSFSMAVTYRPTHQMTDIYVLCEGGRFSKAVLTKLNEIDSAATHPLALPLLFFQLWIERVDFTNNAAHTPLNKVRNEVHDLEHISAMEAGGNSVQQKSEKGVESESEVSPVPQGLQQSDIQKSEYELGNLDVPFLEAFATSLEQSFSNLDALDLKPDVQGHLELKELFRHLQSYLTSVASRRVMLKEKVAFQQQTLYFNLQQRDAQTNLDISIALQKDSKTNIRIAQAMQRDSVAMRTIAALTMAFLPLTAVAAIFSMPFFSLSSSSDPSRIAVTSDFYIYWAVVVPLTIVVFVGWRLFLYNRWSIKESQSMFNV